MRKSGEEKREMMGSAMTDNRMAICGWLFHDRGPVVDQTQLGTSDRSRFQLRFEIVGE